MARRPRQSLRTALLVAALASAEAAAAQAPRGNGALPDYDIWSVAIGAPVTQIPDRAIAFAACGTDGGPPSRILGGVGDFAFCRPEASGLHEVTFKYDDERAYVARAQQSEYEALSAGTTIAGHPVIVSVLVDDGGLVRGVRIVTDDRTTVEERSRAVTLATELRNRFGSWNLACRSLPPADGETPVGRLFIHDVCTGATTGPARQVRIEGRYFRRKGQTGLDPRTLREVPGDFESRTRVDIVQQPSAAGYETVAAPAQPAVTQPAAAIADAAAAAFLAGTARDCPGCNLAGADLKRRDLSGANLAGADLHGATLHRAILAGADLSGANLGQANLNKTDLKRARLAAANLAGAMLYEADLGAADLTGAGMEGVALQRARLMQAKMAKVRLTGAIAREARFSGADLSGADLRQSNFGAADFQRASLAGARLESAGFVEARLANADLSRTVGYQADFLAADLTGAILTDADLRDSRLERAILKDAEQTGLQTKGAILPDGTVGR